MYKGHFKQNRNGEKNETVELLMELFADELYDDDVFEIQFTPEDEEENPIFFRPVSPDVRERMKKKKENLEKTIEKLGGKKK